MRLIDADAFWEPFERGRDILALIKTVLPPEVVDATNAMFDELKERLDNTPTIKPERQKGEWINMIEKGFCYCNQCGFTQETERAYASLFCSKCGADMRGKQE